MARSIFGKPLLRTCCRLKANADIKAAVIDPLGTQGWLRMNHLHPPFNNPKARQAVLWAVNQEEYLQAIIGDPTLYKACAAYFICGTPNETQIGTEALKAVNLDKAKQLLKEAGVAVSPGVGFGQYGDDHVRFALIENEHRTRQALRGIRKMFKNQSMES